jgi:hypothetical protein
VFEGATVAPPPGPARFKPLTGQDSCRQAAKVIVANQPRLSFTVPTRPRLRGVMKAQLQVKEVHDLGIKAKGAREVRNAGEDVREHELTFV